VIKECTGKLHATTLVDLQNRSLKPEEAPRDNS